MKLGQAHDFDFFRTPPVLLNQFAASATGREVAHRIAPEGAHGVWVDLNAEAENKAGELIGQLGQGHGHGRKRHFGLRPGAWPERQHH